MIKDVVDSGACCSCGICIASCPEKALELDNSYLPRVLDSCTNCGICREICPRVEMPFSDIANLLKKENNIQYEEELLGNYNQIFLARMSDSTLREKTYCGGSTTAFLIYLLEKGLIDKALLTGKEHDLSFCGHPKPVVASSKEEILACADTKPTANPILAKLPVEGGKIAFVGTPCHVQGIRKAQYLTKFGKVSKERCKELVGNIEFVIGLNCFFAFKKDGVDQMLSKVGLNEKDLKKFYNWKGKSVALLPDGKKIEDFGEGGDFDSLNLGCLLCYPSYSAKLSDITFGKCMIEEWGWNDVISRSEKADRILREMIEQKILEVIPLNKDERSEILEGLLEANVFKYDTIGYGEFLKTGKFNSTIPLGGSPMDRGSSGSIKGLNRLRLIQAVKRDSFYEIVKQEREKAGMFIPELK